MNYSKFSNTIPYPGGHHWKADVLGFPKMWYFLSVTVFKGELLAVKVKSNFKKKLGHRRHNKKRHAHNFDFSGLKRIAKVTHRVDHTCYSFQTRKLKIVAVSFFLTPPNFGDAFTFAGMM